MPDQLDAYTAERVAITRAFAANFRVLREATHQSQEVFAKEARLHRTQITLLERGLRAPGLLTLLILADALDATPNQLLAGLPAPRERKPKTQHYKPRSKQPDSA